MEYPFKGVWWNNTLIWLSGNILNQRLTSLVSLYMDSSSQSCKALFVILKMLLRVWTITDKIPGIDPCSKHDSSPNSDGLSDCDERLHPEGVAEHAQQVAAQEQRREHRRRAEHAVHVLTLVVRLQLIEQVL